ncbi:hypothetical protein APUTEX25_000709, partial [Auxenochlorella protothecoides]
VPRPAPQTPGILCALPLDLGAPDRAGVAGQGQAGPAVPCPSPVRQAGGPGAHPRREPSTPHRAGPHSNRLLPPDPLPGPGPHPNLGPLPGVQGGAGVRPVWVAQGATGGAGVPAPAGHAARHTQHPSGLGGAAPGHCPRRPGERDLPRDPGRAAGRRGQRVAAGRGRGGVRRGGQGRVGERRAGHPAAHPQRHAGAGAGGPRPAASPAGHGGGPRSRPGPGLPGSVWAGAGAGRVPRLGGALLRDLLWRPAVPGVWLQAAEHPEAARPHQAAARAV